MPRSPTNHLAPPLILPRHTCRYISLLRDLGRNLHRFPGQSKIGFGLAYFNCAFISDLHLLSCYEASRASSSTCWMVPGFTFLERRYGYSRLLSYKMYNNLSIKSTRSFFHSKSINNFLKFRIQNYGSVSIPLQACAPNCTFEAT